MSNAKKTAGKTAEIPESKTVNVCGVISDMMYGKRTYNNGRKDKEDKYRLSLKLADGQMEKFAEIAAPYYANADETYIPKFLKEDAEDEDLEYLNFKSSYSWNFVQRTENGEFEELGDFNSVLEKYGNINGSKVVMTVKLKDGAFYPVGCCIVELKQKSLTEFYNDMDFDELPF